MNALEIIALIAIILAVIKILVILINPSSWLKVIKTVYAQPWITAIISLILAGIVLNYLLQELTIVQIFASMMFFALLTMIGIAGYKKEITEWAEQVLKEKELWKKAWLALIIWGILIIWVIYSILA